MASQPNNRSETRLTSWMVSVLVAALIAAAGLGVWWIEASTDEQTPQATSSELVFDPSYVHEISVSFDQAAYEELVETYQETGEKAWIEATVTIDGETYETAGMRLKGNSSLRVLGGGFGDSAGSAGRDGSGDASEPQQLPWLIKLDKYIEGQSHHGVHDFVVRSNNSETALNEAAALDLLEAAGLASQDAMYVAFSVNGSDAVLRLAIEHPDDVWMAGNFDASGALYKAEATGDYTYRGSDPDAYDEVFDQEAGEDNADLTPLIEFLDFINNADDDTFHAELPKRLDIDEFATYLAMQELIANFDDIDGPGNNSYLFYDTTSGMFTVVAWDHNLAFGGLGGVAGLGGDGRAFGQGASDEGFSLGGPGGDTPAFGRSDEGASAGDSFPRGGLDGDAPALRQNEGDESGEGGFTGRPPGSGGGNVGPAGGNVLVERFLANEEWQALYEERLAELTAEIMESGTAQEVLDQWVDLLTSEAGELVSPTTVTQEADQIASYFTD